MSKDYRGVVAVQALTDVSLTIMPGEYVALIGPSGSGKSTLLHLIGCLDLPSSGVVIINGQPTSDLSAWQLAALRSSDIGFVFQDFHLIATKTAIENVFLPLQYQRLARTERLRRAGNQLERLGLADRSHHLPCELSGGERQRVAIARALVSNPTVLIADEPTGNLDSVNGRLIVQELRRLADMGMAVVVATHSDEVAIAADRRHTLTDGVLSEMW